MRRVLIGGVVLVALVSLGACGGGDDTTTDSPAGGGAASTAAGRDLAAALETKTLEAGAVTVKIDPVRLDPAAAEFKVTFDTHSVELGLDVARNSTLTVGTTPWSGATWSGDGPSGHHREGTLRFSAAGPAKGGVVLSIGGLPAPVTASWSLGS